MTFAEDKQWFQANKDLKAVVKDENQLSCKSGGSDYSSFQLCWISFPSELGEVPYKAHILQSTVLQICRNIQTK